MTRCQCSYGAVGRIRTYARTDIRDTLEEGSRIKCPPMDIEFKEGAVLPQDPSCRNTPFYMKPMADKFIKDALAGGVI